MLGIINTFNSVSGYLKSGISSIFSSKETTTETSSSTNSINSNRALSTEGIEFNSLKENKLPQRIIDNLQSKNFTLHNHGLISNLDYTELLKEINEYYESIEKNNPKKSYGKISEHTKLIINKTLNQKFQELSQIEANNSEHTAKEKFEKFFKDYFTTSFNLTSELQKIFTIELIKQKNLNQGLLITQAEISKEISTQIAISFLNKINDIVNHIPDVKVAENLTLKQSIIEQHSQDIRKLVIMANFGAFQEDLINSVYDSELLNQSIENKEKDLYNVLSLLASFQKNTQGALVISENKDETKISSFNLGLASQALIFYIQSIIKRFEVNYDTIPNSQQHAYIEQLEFSKNDLRQFLLNIVNNELNTNAKSNELKHVTPLSSIGVDIDEEQIAIKKIFENSLTTFRMLGKNQDKIPGFNIENTYLVSFLNKDDAKRHFERIILEVSLVAGIDAICTYKGYKKSNESLLAKYKNYSGDRPSIPWIDRFYESRCQKMKALIESEKSEIHIAKVVEYISNLALELTKSTHLFDVGNFIERFDIQKPTEDIINYMLTLTRLGVMSLNILFFKSFLSDILSKNENKTNLSNPELRDLKTWVIDVLERESQLKTENNQVIYAPIGDSQAITDAKKRLEDRFADTGFLLSNAGLIMKFLTSSAESVSKIKKAEDREEDFLHSKNIVLASWLFYILVKFLPEESKDAHSLRIRKDVFALMFSDKWRGQKIIPNILYDKLKNQALGTEDDYYEDSKGTKKSKIGVFKSLFNELDSRMEAISKGEHSSIALKDLLYIYSEVENIMKSNPVTLNNINQLHQGKPLLRGLANSIPLVADADLKLVVNFAKKHTNPELKTTLARVLLEKSNYLTKILLKNHINKFGELEIKDSDEAAIKLVIKTLEYLEYLGFLMNDHGMTTNLKINLDTNDFLSSSEKATRKEELQREITPKLSLMDKFLSLKINLIDDPNYSNNQEVFHGQFETKAKFVEQIKKFTNEANFLPAVGITHKWRSEKEIVNLRASSLNSYSEKDIANPRVNSVKSYAEAA